MGLTTYHPRTYFHRGVIMSGITVFGIPPHFVLSLAGGSHNSRHKGIRLSDCRLLLVLIRLSVPRVPTLPPYHPTLSDYLRMRSLYLGNTMSSSSANPNPFARFALAATEAGIRRGAASSLAPARPVESSPAKKIRTALDGKPRDRPEPPKGLQEKYRSPGEPEWPLCLIVVGHNPSEKAWELGHYYANPSNRMWKLLSAAGIVPPGLVASDDDDCPIKCGVGFTDVGFSHPGTVSSEFKRTELHAWRQDFHDRLSAHAERAAATVASVKAVAAYAAPSIAAAVAVKTEPAAAVKTEPAAVVGTEPAAAAAETKPVAAMKTEPTATATLAGRVPRDAGVTVSVEDGCPKIVAFAGKRQWEELFFDASAQDRVQTKGGKAGQFRFGLQPATLRPPGWPFPAQATDVFVLPSSSGAAAMTNEAREGPYRALGDHLSRTGPWAWRDEASRLRVKAQR